MRTRKTKNQASEPSPDRTRRGVGGADFPKNTLAEALEVPQALEDKNGGNPLSPTDVAIALKRSPQASGYRVLLSSSIKYGLTSGSYNQPKILLQELGRNIVEPRSEEERRTGLVAAAFRPDLFKRIYDLYKNKKLPEKTFFTTVLVRDFGVTPEQADRCAGVFLENVEQVGLVKQATTGRFLGSIEDLPGRGGLGPTAGSSPVSRSRSEAESSAEDSVDAEMPQSRPELKNAIFVGHGKNRTPLQQLEKLLSEYKIPYKVVVDEANVGRPISEKVADTMKECGAAIMIFTSDQEFKDSEGNVVFRPSENAVFELGAASALYGSRIVIFRETGVVFPANFRDIGHIEFEKDNLSARTNELFRELIRFGLIKLSVGS